MTQIVSTEWAISLQAQGEIVQGLDCIRQRIRTVLNTRKGTDPLRPRFGVNVLDYVDRPISVVLTEMRKEIMDAIAEFIPEVEITKITGSQIEGKAVFKILYKITNTVDTDIIEHIYG